MNKDVTFRENEMFMQKKEGMVEISKTPTTRIEMENFKDSSTNYNPKVET